MFHVQSSEGNSELLNSELQSAIYLRSLQQASYALRVAGERRVTFLADVFNLFNERRITYYSQNTQLDNNVTNPDFGKPVNTNLAGNPPQYQTPFNMRVASSSSRISKRVRSGATSVAPFFCEVPNAPTRCCCSRFDRCARRVAGLRTEDCR